MSKVQQKSMENFAKIPLQAKIPTTKPKKYQKIKQHIARYSPIDEENDVYVAQLKELARVFSSSGDRHIRQLVINVAKGILERADDYKKAEAYVTEMLS